MIKLSSLPRPGAATRRQTNAIQSLGAQLQRSCEDGDCSLPPQASLDDWLSRGRTLAVKSTSVLQQLTWLLQCCPADPQQKEEPGSCRQHSLSCLSPLTAQRQPPGCLIRKGDAAWHKLEQHVTPVLKDSQRVKTELCVVARQTADGELLTW